MLIETEHSKIYKTAQETGKISNKQYNLTPKGTRKKEQTKPKVNWRKYIIKIRQKSKKQRLKENNRKKKTMKLRSGSLKIFF